MVDSLDGSTELSEEDVQYTDDHEYEQASSCNDRRLNQELDGPHERLLQCDDEALFLIVDFAIYLASQSWSMGFPEYEECTNQGKCGLESGETVGAMYVMTAVTYENAHNPEYPSPLKVRAYQPANWRPYHGRDYLAGLIYSHCSPSFFDWKEVTHYSTTNGDRGGTETPSEEAESHQHLDILRQPAAERHPKECCQT